MHKLAPQPGDSQEIDSELVARAWMAGIMAKGIVFIRKSDGAAVLSLGCSTWAWLGLELEAASASGTKWFKCSAAEPNP